jgi:cytidylate kinase
MAKTIITLGREYCTGGRYIAQDVADALGIKFYDKELITMAAKESGLSEEAVAASEKQHTHSLLYSLYTMGNDLPLGDQVFILQSRIIKKLAEEGPCVILGRCGDYVLRERTDVLRVFVYAPVEFRREYAKTNPVVKATTEKGIREEIEKTDKRRAAYYNYYTQNRWGDAHNYDLAVNAALGKEACVDLILRAVKAKEEQANK